VSETVFPELDYTSLAADLQGALNNAVNQAVMLGAKAAVGLAIAYLVLFLTPRGARLLAGLVLLATVWFYPAVCSRLLDAAVAALAGMGLVPRFNLDLLSLARF
jgi:hypothetical protein